MLAVIFRMRYLINATHKAEYKNGAVRLKSRRKFRGVQLASAGVLFGSQNNIRFRTLEAIVPNHSFAKNDSSPADYLLLNLLN